MMWNKHLLEYTRVRITLEGCLDYSFFAFVLLFEK